MVSNVVHFSIGREHGIVKTVYSTSVWSKTSSLCKMDNLNLVMKLNVIMKETFWNNNFS